MARLIDRCVGGLLLLMAASASAETKSYRFWAGEIPPYSFVDADGKPRGTVYQVFQALVERMGYTQKVEIVPWKRVLMETQKPQPILFIPAARSPDREKLYSWVAPILDETFGIFTLPARAREGAEVERARRLHVCSLRGSATEELVHRHRFVQVEWVGTNDICARLLKAGRVDAWIAAKKAALASFQQVGYDLKDLAVGATLERWPLYLAASKAVPEEELERWRAALQKMKDDGSFDRLLN